MENQSARRSHRRIFAFLCFVGILAFTATPTTATCQFCWLTDAGFLGQCLDVLNANPGLPTMSNCVGTLICYPYLGGQICIPGCLGDPCFWV